MNQNKVYLLMCATGSYEDYRNVPVDAFTSKELAEKTANGFNDVVDILLLEAEDKLKERDTLIDVFPIDLTDEQNEEIDKIYEEYSKYGDVQWDTPSYSVEEIDLIN